MFRLRFCLLVLLLVPLTALAERVVRWDFRNPADVIQWNATVTSAVSSTADGLLIRPVGRTVTVFHKGEFPHRIDSMRFTMAAPRGAQGLFLWHIPGTAENEVIQLPFVIQPSVTPMQQMLPLEQIHNWDPRADVIGFAFDAGTEVLLIDVQGMHWSFDERLIEAWKSFWTFDVFTRYSVNFLWGPVLTFTPSARAMLFTQLPPFGWSFNRVLLPFLVVIVAATIVWARVRRSPRETSRAALIAIGCITGAWLLFDVRMGMELLSYAKRDFTTFVMRPLGQRELRYMEDFHDVLDISVTLVDGKKRIGFVSDPRYLLDSAAAYAFYPALVTKTDADQSGIDTWLVYRQPLARVTPSGQLMLDAQPLSPAGGRITQHFGPASFLFTTAP
ncbi:MAG: hypothetical protein G01um101425_452 [Candidatus Peregrinibacteria bacterium Gr01-1014_25]|nr:MAG: hypothetical protein G01um101425_452 [Candidatus Peregrinibacteria bacterium Gr01-1014_25]